MLREVFEKGKELADRVTNIVMNYTDVEAKVRFATNDDPWGPHGQDMHEIAEYTKHYDTLSQVMGMLWRRMFYEQKSNWRRTYKSLLLLSYLLRNGSERIVISCKEHIYDLKLLESYQFIDENGKDQGVNIRHKAKDVISVLENDFRLSSERKKAAMNRNKFQGGISSTINGHRYHHEQKDYSKSQPTLSNIESLEDDDSVKKKTETTKPIELSKPVQEEVVGDLLDLNCSSVSPPAQNISHIATTVVDNTFDPFNLNTEVKSFTAPPVPSLPTSPAHLNNRYSDDFDNFVSAPLPSVTGIETATSSNFNDLDLLFQSTNFISNDKLVMEPVTITNSNTNSINSSLSINNYSDKTESSKQPKIGATWTNTGSIDISLDLLTNRNRQSNSSTQRSLNQLQREFCNNPNQVSRNNLFSPNNSLKQQQQQFVMATDTRVNSNCF